MTTITMWLVVGDSDTKWRFYDCKLSSGLDYPDIVQQILDYLNMTMGNIFKVSLDNDFDRMAKVCLQNILRA